MTTRSATRPRRPDRAESGGGRGGASIRIMQGDVRRRCPSPTRLSTPATRMLPLTTAEIERLMAESATRSSDRAAFSSCSCATPRIRTTERSCSRRRALRDGRLRVHFFDRTLIDRLADSWELDGHGGRGGQTSTTPVCGHPAQAGGLTAGGQCCTEQTTRLRLSHGCRDRSVQEIHPLFALSTSISPRSSNSNWSCRRAWVASLSWIAPGSPCDCIRLAVFTVLPQRS